MAREALNVPMNIGSGRTVFVPVPQKIIDYFGMTAAVTAGTTTAITRERKPHTRKRYKADSLGTATENPIAVGTARWQDVGGRKLKGRAKGKLIKIPTEIPNVPGDLSKGYRITSLRVPGSATNYCIAMWLNTTMTTKKPAYFITPSGQSYPVAVPTVADPNPGNGATPTPTP